MLKPALATAAPDLPRGDGAAFAASRRHQVPRIIARVENKIEPAYIRTRHNNLRCFPECAKVHKVKSFCGTPLVVRVVPLDGAQSLAAKSVRVFGEFRSTTKGSGATLFSPCPSDKHGDFIHAQLSTVEDDGSLIFTVHPPRKWQYKGRLTHLLDMHVFTAYVVLDDTVIGIAETAEFQIIPIWKTDESTLKSELIALNEDGEEEDDVSDVEVNPTSSSVPSNTSSLKRRRIRLEHEASTSNQARLLRNKGKDGLEGQVPSLSDAKCEPSTQDDRSTSQSLPHWRFPHPGIRAMSQSSTASSSSSQSSFLSSIGLTSPPIFSIETSLEILSKARGVQQLLQSQAPQADPNTGLRPATAVMAMNSAHDNLSLAALGHRHDSTHGPIAFAKYDGMHHQQHIPSPIMSRHPLSSQLNTLPSTTYNSVPSGPQYPLPSSFSAATHFPGPFYSPRTNNY